MAELLVIVTPSSWIDIHNKVKTIHRLYHTYSNTSVPRSDLRYRLQRVREPTDFHTNCQIVTSRKTLSFSNLQCNHAIAYNACVRKSLNSDMNYVAAL